MKKHFILYFMATLSLFALPSAIEGFIKKSTIPKKDMAIYIKQVGQNAPALAALNETTLKTPASVIKVLSTYASVLKLGFDYRFPTKFYTIGLLHGGVLDGDLVVKAFGDPTLNSKDLEKIVEQIKAKGIQKITGNIIIDRTFFRVSTKNSSGFDENPYSAYNAMPDAMMYNERISTICITPRTNGISKKGKDASYEVINQLKTVSKPCRGRYSWPGVKIDTTQTTPKVYLKGKISNHCSKQNICQVVTKPYLSFYYALKDKLKREGVEVEGNMRLRKVPQMAKPLFTHYSRSLEKIISKTAKKSNNLYARHLLLTLGAHVYGAPSTLEKGRRAVEQILRDNGALSQNGLQIDNGCGLSRTAKLSAKMLADMYDNAYSRYGERWMQTLSIAGVDGTIKKRFRGSVVKNKAWMKTGTLKRTKNISGYVKDASGQLYEVVILVQSNRGNWRASQLQNDIITWLARRKSSNHASKSTSVSHTGSSDDVVVDTKAINAKYYVQAGSFSEVPKKSFLLKIERMGLLYKVRYLQKHKVLIGPYAKEKDARETLKSIREKVNPKAFIVKL